MFRAFASTLILLATPLTASGDVSVVFGPSPDLPKTIVKAIDKATWTLDVAIYNIDHSEIVTSMEQAAKDGVRIRLILNKPTSTKKLTTIANRMEAAGVDVRYVNLTMHHKFAVIDSKALLTGSCNWTNNAFARYDEDLLTFRNEPAYVDAFRAEFEKLWSCSKEFGITIFNPTIITRPKPGFGRAVFTSGNMTEKEHRGERIFSTSLGLADGVCGCELIEAINKAEKTIAIATTHFRRKDIAFALENALARGVRIRILLDMQEYHLKTTTMNDVRYDEELAELGAKVRYKCYANKWTYQRALQLHVKFMVVDARTVLTGSLNWSVTSELRTIENLIVLDRPVLTNVYSQRFDMMWNYGKGNFTHVLESAQTSREELFSFAPISITGPKVDALLTLTRSVMETRFLNK